MFEKRYQLLMQACVEQGGAFGLVMMDRQDVAGITARVTRWAGRVGGCGGFEGLGLHTGACRVLTGVSRLEGLLGL